MRSRKLPPAEVRFALNRTGRRMARRVFPVLFMILANAAVLFGRQQPDDTPPADKQNIQLLLQRIDQLEARVKQLESPKPETPAVQPAKTTAPPQESAQTTAPAEQEPEQPTERTEPERMDVSRTLLRIRGFGDINFHGDNQKGDTTSFTLGQLNLFVTSDVSDKFRFIGEIVFEAGSKDNNFGVDVERLLIQYSHSDYLKLAAGRYHTAIGYYNTAYHHSTWFQTTTGRPFLFQFEDGGGILPVHNVGVSATGLIPSGPLGLHYVAEVGNGRASRSPLTSEPVQNVVDENNHKAFNLGLFVRPDRVRGLQAGLSVYRDKLAPTALPRIGETILAAHAVYVHPNFEWLNEALVIRHTPEGLGHTFDTPGFYSQISKRFGPYRPYFRYQYVNGSDNEPVFPDVGLRHGPSVGLRYDASESVALKLQYDYTMLRQKPAVSSVGLQVGFTF